MSYLLVKDLMQIEIKVVFMNRSYWVKLYLLYIQ